jgi:ubiquitin C-terminal hydrolase
MVVTLEECLTAFASEEYMDAMGYKCSKCKAEDTCTKQMTIYRFPKVMVIHMKRFDNVGFSRREKLNTRIEIPLSINMGSLAPHN